MAQIKVEKAKIDQKQTSLLVIGVFENEQDFSQSKELDPSVLTYIKEAIDNKDFRGTFGASILVYTLGNGPLKKIMLIGLGKREKFTDEMARICAGKAAQKAKEVGAREFTILHFSSPDEPLVEAMAEGIAL